MSKEYPPTTAEDRDKAMVHIETCDLDLWAFSTKFVGRLIVQVNELEEKLKEIERLGREEWEAVAQERDELKRH